MSQRTKRVVVIHKKHLKRCILYYRVVGYLLGYNKRCFLWLTVRCNIPYSVGHERKRQQTTNA